MKDGKVTKKLRQIGHQLSRKKVSVDALVDDVLDCMKIVGGITGLKTKSYSPITIHNHTDSYSIPVRMNPSDEISSKGSQMYDFFERLVEKLYGTGITKDRFEFHLGKDYSSKHHQPQWYKSL